MPGHPARAAALLLTLPILASCGGSGSLQVSESGAGAYEPALVAIDGGAAVAWYDNRDGNAEIYLRLVGVEPKTVSPEYRLTWTGAESYEASIDRLGDGLAVAWCRARDRAAWRGLRLDLERGAPRAGRPARRRYPL